MTCIYLSRLVLNVDDPHARRELADVYQLHRTVMSGFPPQLPAGERVLFRLDEDRAGRHTLLVQSRTAPDWGGLAAGYLLPGDPFDPLPNPAVKRVDLAFEAGRLFRFRLRANPTRKQRRENKAQGRRVAVAGEEAQRAWLGRKAEQGGFGIHDHDVVVSKPGREFGRTRPDPRDDQRHQLEFHVIQFDGLLRVTDAQRFAETLAAGIGPAKGFGCGLLSLAPA